ncbi:uncharacterized protein JN550_008081 [Neoarthrinium moseri]|uniref:uncharacterized protein n=1 Tax=Neoarthrinium moseri TaxID=1658444 RepID=UPI001FDC40AB|nr:uncharacterized protein JN550_008081 [Neoarthrinium moseri]KAI1865823.1 hypothetical protein JN550_008081 [Neoarthrinium moseri]
MRQFTSLCSPCRRSVLLLKSSPALGASHVPIRYSSLSAIHRGLRDSEKTRPQGFANGALKTTGSSRTKRNTSRNRRDQDWTPPTFTIKKGKKDITDEGPQPKSRKARFNDPTETFGKKSLVYQMKHGDLRQKLSALAGGKEDNNRSADLTSFEGKFESAFGPSSTRGAKSRDDDRRGRDSRARAPDRRSDRGGRPSRDDRPSFDRRPGRDGQASFDRRPARPSRPSFDNRPPRDDRTSFGDRAPRDDRPSFGGRPTRDSDSRRQLPDRTRSTDFMKPGDRPAFSPRSRPTEDEQPFRKSSFRDDLPIRIHHTTAASQFLYGRSVVEAALKDSRRKLYHLYLYAGEDRKNLVQDAGLQNLAERKQVKITKLTDNDGLRMMDKMSVGRPHNGCVLEASPLPQLPLKSLGELSEDPEKPGFSIELAHQSSEEAAINGTSDFISYRAPPGRKPFVLLLDGILDPGNLGAILRSAAFLGVTGVAISNSGSAGLTPVSLKASAGASEVLPLYSVSSTLDFIQRSKEAGWMIYASVAAGPRSRGNSHLTLERVEAYDPLSEHPTILVIGSEGEGLGKPVKRIADFEVSIPGNASLLSTVDSLNVSVATGILCSSFLKKSQGFEIEEAMDDIKAKEGETTTLW